jgi:hypothetical protein
LEIRVEEDEFAFEEHLQSIGAGGAEDVVGMEPHDPLKFGGGESWSSVLSWWSLGKLFSLVICARPKN